MAKIKINEFWLGSLFLVLLILFSFMLVGFIYYLIDDEVQDYNWAKVLVVLVIIMYLLSMFIYMRMIKQSRYKKSKDKEPEFLLHLVIQVILVSFSLFAVGYIFNKQSPDMFRIVFKSPPLLISLLFAMALHILFYYLLYIRTDVDNRETFQEYTLSSFFNLFSCIITIVIVHLTCISPDAYASLLTKYFIPFLSVFVGLLFWICKKWIFKVKPERHVSV